MKKHIELNTNDNSYIIIISSSVESGTTVSINITNKANNERFNNSEYNAKNLFNPIFVYNTKK